MTITLDQITTQQERLQREILERESILAALGVLHTFVKNRPGKKSVELGSLLSVFGSATIDLPVKELSEASAPVTETVPEPPALPAPPPVERYIHPELKALGESHCSDTKFVRWAIGQMTRDYSVHHLAALLKREGRPLNTAQISVVISRLKSRGEIEETRRGQGPIPALFRRPDISRPADFKPLDLDLKLPPPPYRHLRGSPLYAFLPAEYRIEEAESSAGDRSTPVSEA